VKADDPARIGILPLQEVHHDCFKPGEVDVGFAKHPTQMAEIVNHQTKIITVGWDSMGASNRDRDRLRQSGLADSSR